MTTVDPSTGEKDPDVEPLQMLREYVSLFTYADERIL